jgi:antirestriction protein ArdC
MKDVYQEITNQIVAAIERGNVGQWRMPWHTTGASSSAPVNAISKKPYRGVNILALWAAAQSAGYPRNEWATYQQWSSVGAQVRKRERSTLVVFWKFSDAKPSDQNGDEDGEETNGRRQRVLVRGYNVFNVAQVDNAPAPVEPELTEAERIETADQFFKAVGSDVWHGGDRAYYSPVTDHIQMPVFKAFHEPVSYYSTLAHENTHWTAPKSRCNRDLGQRFGDQAYAAEELIAELGAAFVCAHLGLANHPREDHAQYVSYWLKVLKADSRAIFTAASKAQQASDYLTRRRFSTEGPPVEAREHPSMRPSALNCAL